MQISNCQMGNRRTGLRGLLLAGLPLMGIVLMGMGGLASAQVAAPALNPYTFVTENPAVMQWGSPSRIGVSYAQAQTVTDPSSVTDNFDGMGVGGRYVGPRFSAAADYTRLDSSNTPFNTGAEYRETAQAALGVRLGDHLALGIGQQNDTQRAPNVPGVSAVRHTHETPQGGLSIRMGEWFFLGGSGGTETYKFEDLMDSSNNLNTSRDVYTYGVGIRTGGTVMTHFEYYVVDKSSWGNSNALLNSSIVPGRENSRTGVIELNWGGALIGYSATHTERDTGVDTTDNYRAELGWAPPTGVTVVVLGDVRRDSLPSGSFINSVTTTTYRLAITYMFAGVK